MVHNEKPIEATAEVIEEKQPKTLVDTVFDLGTTWAEYGLSCGKFALEHSAKALSRTADTLGDIADKLKSEEGHSTR
jgi:hypothetical protein